MDVSHKEHFHKAPGGTAVLISTNTLSKSAFKERETAESTGLTCFMEPAFQVRKKGSQQKKDFKFKKLKKTDLKCEV